jgi:hypothetical protein
MAFLAAAFVALLVLSGWALATVRRPGLMATAILSGTALTATMSWYVSSYHGPGDQDAIVIIATAVVAGAGLFGMLRRSPEEGLAVWAWAMLGAALPAVSVFTLFYVACSGVDQCLS